MWKSKQERISEMENQQYFSAMRCNSAVGIGEKIK